MWASSVKTLALIKRKPGLDRDAFREHYESGHVPLALPLLAGLVRYARYHVTEVCYGEAGFDVLTAFWYRDKAAIEGVFEMLAGPAGAPLLADELTFMNKPANRFCAVSERRIAEDKEGGSSEEGDEHLFVSLRRPASVSRYDASQNVMIEQGPELIDALGGASFALLRDGFAVEGSDAPFDSLIQLRCDGVRGLEAWARRMESSGYDVSAVRTRRFETPRDLLSEF